MLQVRVLGDLGVELDGERIELPRSIRACALLGWLAIHPGRHSRPRVAALFWPDVLDSSSRASLRSAIWALRSALGPDAGAHLVTDRDSIELGGPGLSVDVREFARLLSDGRAAEAVGLCRGPLLNRFDDDWVFEAREEHDTAVAAALGALRHTAAQAGDQVAAVAWARRRTALRPLDESAADDLMAALANAGDTAAALEVYRRLRQRLRDELDVEPSPALERRARELRTAAPAEATGPVVAQQTTDQESRLIGRDRELAQLLRSWRATAAGQGQVVVVTGEGGIGKTRLVHELRATARQQGGITARGVTDRLAAAQPFGSWAELVVDLVAQLGRPPGGLAAELSWVVPGVLSRNSAPPPVRPVGDPKLDRVRFFEAVVDLIAWACRDRPMLVVVEDLHLADASSVELTGYVGRRLARLSALLAVTWRRLPPRPDLEALLGGLRSRGACRVELELGPLGAESVRELARGTAALTDHELDEIVAVAAGSPLVAAETSRAYGRGDPAAGLRDTVRSSMSPLPDPARRFVEIVAVAGRDLERAEIPALPVFGDPNQAATAALGAGLLQARDGAIGFRHALLREAVYAEIPDPLRAGLHEAFAQGLRGRPGARQPAEIARHFRLAGRDELAAVQLARAAAEARRMSALREAADYLTEASDITPDDPDVLVELADVQAWRGHDKASDRAFDRALEMIDPADSGALVSAHLRRARWMRGALCHPRECRVSYRTVLDVLDREGTPDPLTRAEALAGMAWAEGVAGDLQLVDKLLRDVDELIGHDPPADLLAHDIGTARGFACIRAGRFTDCYGPMIAAAAAAIRAERPDMAYGCLANAAGAAACAGEYDRALELADRCVDVVVPNGLIQPAIYIHTGRSALFRRLDQLAEARTACDLAAGLADRVGLAELNGLVHHERGLIALAAGDPLTAATELDLALAQNAPVSRPLVRLLRAEALARSARFADAESELRLVALEPVTPNDFPDTLVARMCFVQGLLARTNNDRVAAERLFRQAADSWRRRVESGNVGETYAASFVDLGRPPISTLVEPERELARVCAELEGIGDVDVRRG